MTTALREQLAETARRRERMEAVGDEIASLAAHMEAAMCRSLGLVAEYDESGAVLCESFTRLRRAAVRYPSLRISIVSGRTPSYFMASAAASVCMNSWKAAKSGISTISPTLFEPSGSWNVRAVMPIGPKISSRFGELSQCWRSSTSWNAR